LSASSASELNSALRGVQRSAADAFMVSSEVIFLANRAQIAQVVAKAKLPAIFPWPEYHDVGVLMSYGASLKEMGRQAAIYVDRILKGAKPGELPVEQSATFKLIINLKAAKALGITIPNKILLRADEVIP